MTHRQWVVRFNKKVRRLGSHPAIFGRGEREELIEQYPHNPDRAAEFVVDAHRNPKPSKLVGWLNCLGQWMGTIESAESALVRSVTLQ